MDKQRENVGGEPVQTSVTISMNSSIFSYRRTGSRAYFRTIHTLTLEIPSEAIKKKDYVYEHLK